MADLIGNPFYRNHVFNGGDARRIQINWRDKLRVLFRPMYIQLSEGHEVHYKTLADGRIFIFKMKPYKQGHNIK